VMIFGKNASRIWEEAKSNMSLQKFGLEVWTSGMLVNVWNQSRKSRDVKDIHVRVHTRIIL
jgi:hypothetical protein